MQAWHVFCCICSCVMRCYFARRICASPELSFWDHFSVKNIGEKNTVCFKRIHFLYFSKFHFVCIYYFVENKEIDFLWCEIRLSFEFYIIVFTSTRILETVQYRKAINLHLQNVTNPNWFKLWIITVFIIEMLRIFSFFIVCIYLFLDWELQLCSRTWEDKSKILPGWYCWTWSKWGQSNFDFGFDMAADEKVC